jgi:hypothetical protein
MRGTTLRLGNNHAARPAPLRLEDYRAGVEAEPHRRST